MTEKPSDRTVTISDPPDYAGKVTVKAVQEADGQVISLGFRWPATDVDSEAYKTAFLALHRSMDHVLATPAARRARDFPWGVKVKAPPSAPAAAPEAPVAETPPPRDTGPQVGRAWQGNDTTTERVTFGKPKGIPDGNTEVAAADPGSESEPPA